MNSKLVEYITKCKKVCDGGSNFDSSGDQYSIPLAAIKQKNLVVSSSENDALSYIDMEEENPQTKSFGLGNQT